MFLTLFFCLCNFILSLSIQNPLGACTQRGSWVKMLSKWQKEGCNFIREMLKCFSLSEFCGGSYCKENVERKVFDHWEIRWHCLSCWRALELYSVSSISLYSCTIISFLIVLDWMCNADTLLIWSTLTCISKGFWNRWTAKELIVEFTRVIIGN